MNENMNPGQRAPEEELLKTPNPENKEMGMVEDEGEKKSWLGKDGLYTTPMTREKLLEDLENEDRNNP